MDETCQNCGETNIDCACIRNKCIICGAAVGNITFTRCDAHWTNSSTPETRGGLETDMPGSRDTPLF